MAKDAKRELYGRMLRMLVVEHIMRLERLVEAEALRVEFGGFVAEDGKPKPAITLILDGDALQREVESRRDERDSLCEVIDALMAKMLDEQQRADAPPAPGIN